jgi:hypothetical protein
MAALTGTNFTDYLLDNWIKPGRLYEELYKDSPFLGLIKKNTKVGGRKMVVPTQYAQPAGTSNTYATAVSGQSPGKYDAFEFAWVNKYTRLSITDNLIAQCSNDQYKVADAIDREVKTGIGAQKREICANLQRGTGGALGKISSISTTTITLTRTSDSYNFQVGDVIYCSSGNGDASGDSLRSGTPGYGTITAIDNVAGTVVCATNWNTLMGATAGDYLFKAGSFQNSCAGVGGWVPFSTPTTGDSFGTIDRSLYPQILAGSVYTGTSETNMSAINNACGYILTAHGAPSHIFMHPMDLARLANSVDFKGANIVLNGQDDKGKTLKIGFKATEVHTFAGIIPIVADPYVPEYAPFITQIDTWELQSVGGDLVRFPEYDGLTWRRSSSADAWDADLKSYYNLGCNNPAASCRVILKSA